MVDKARTAEKWKVYTYLGGWAEPEIDNMYIRYNVHVLHMI